MSEIQFKVPKLRFPEFREEWEYKRLDDIAKVGTGDKDTQDRIISGTYPFFVRSNQVERINSYSYNGEAILTAGDGVGVGKVFHYVNGKFDFHQRVYAIRDFNKSTVGKFTYYYFSSRFYDRVIRMSAKNSVDSVRMEMIAGMQIPQPSFEEQEKVSSFLTTMDEKISGLQQKKELLQKYKKGVMQAIFSQKIRFKDDGKDYPAWEEKILGDLFDRITIKNTIGNKNVLTISAQHGLISQEQFFNKLVSAQDLSGYYLLSRGDFAYNKSYSNGYPMGAIKRLNKYDTGIVSSLYICFRLKDRCSEEFYDHYFDAGLQNRVIEKIAQEGARNHGLLNISVNDFFNQIKINVPCVLEQQKIADFLTTLDNKINLTVRKLDEAQKFKKALLQQLFV